LSESSQPPSPGLALHLGWVQTLYYSAYYYLYPALMPQVLEDQGWAQWEYTLGASLVLILAGLLAPLAGHWVDRFWGLRLMGISGLLGATGLLVLSWATGPAPFWAGSVLLGLAAALGLYDVCFSHLARIHGQGSSGAITLVTLMAGFASTITFPLGHYLALHWGWPWAFRLFALLILLTSLSLFWREVLHSPQRRARRRANENAPPEPGASALAQASTSSASPDPSSPAQARLAAAQTAGKQDSPPQALPGALLVLVFLILSRAFFMAVNKMIHTQSLPFFGLLSLGIGVPVLLASAFGPVQVLGRLVFAGLDKARHPDPIKSTLLIHGFLVLGTLALGLSLTWGPSVLAFVFFHGTAVGVFTILTPQIAVLFFGQQNVGRMSGLMALFTNGTTALAPVLSSALVAGAGLEWLPLVLLVVALLSLTAFALAARLRNRKNVVDPV